MVWRQEHIGRVMFTTETNRCIYNVGVKSSRANASDGAKNRYPFRDGRTMFFLDQVYVNHGTSCPVRRAIWYTSEDPHSRRNSLQRVVSYSILSIIPIMRCTTGHPCHTCVLHGVYCMDMGYPMGSPMEYPNRGWIPLNLPWKYHMTIAWHAPWFRRGTTRRSSMDRFMPWTKFTGYLSWASHGTSCEKGHELPCPSECTMGHMPWNTCFPWYVPSVTSFPRGVRWCNMGHTMGCRMVYIPWRVQLMCVCPF